MYLFINDQEIRRLERNKKEENKKKIKLIKEKLQTDVENFSRQDEQELNRIKKLTKFQIYKK